MSVRRTRFAAPLVALGVTAVLAVATGCTSSGSDADKPARISPAPTSSPEELYANPYLPERLLTVKDAQKLMANVHLKGSECYKDESNFDTTFPSNARICDFSTSAEPVFVRVATIVDNKTTKYDYVNNSSLLADTDGTTGRFAIGEHINGLPPYSANVYVACDHYKISDGKECPFPGEAKMADRIVFTVNVPASKSAERVTVIIGIAGQKKHDISVELLDTAANTAIKNLKQEFNKQ